MADDTLTVEQARQAALARMHCPERSLGDASRQADMATLDALIAAVRAEMVCPQCEAHGLPSHLIPR